MFEFRQTKQTKQATKSSVPPVYYSSPSSHELNIMRNQRQHKTPLIM